MEKSQVIQKMYNVLLHRDPDSEGLRVYTEKLNKNIPVFKLIQAISSSEEYLKCQLKLIKSNTPSVYELQNFVNDYETDIESLTKQLETSNELFDQNCQQLQHLQQENQKLKDLLDKQNTTDETTDYKIQLEVSTQTDHEMVKYNVPVRIRNKLINKITQTVNVFMCVRNNEQTLQSTFDQLLNIQNTYNIKMNYFIYENDSTDLTPFVIIDFYRNNNVKGAYKIEKLSKKEWTDVKDINRSADMATYRNTMKNLCNEEYFEHSEYSLIVDTDVEFTPKNFFDMIKLLKSNQTIAMVTPYAYAGNTLDYYDTYALDSPKNICVLMPEIQEVKSAFGGFVVIKTNVLQKCSWDIIPDKLCSEHNYFCNMVQTFGKVVIARDIRVHWRNKFT